MSKFYVGQKVLVTGSTFAPILQTRAMVGKVGIIDSVYGLNGTVSVDCNIPGGSAYFNPSDLQPITETPETLTINGVEYIRKPEPVVDHEWKLGDVAVHERYGVVVVGPAYHSGELRIFTVDDFSSADPSSLTFIRRTDFSV